MGDAFILVTAFFAGFVAFTQSPAKAFLNIYLPILLFIPVDISLLIPGLPHPNIDEAVIIPIAFVYFLAYGKQWRFSLMDVLIIGFAFCSAYSICTNEGSVNAEHFTFSRVGSVILPYAMAKALIESNAMRIDFSRKLVKIMSCVAIFSIWEFRMGENIFKKFFGLIYPLPYGFNVHQIRWGFTRTVGPFPHAILCGLMMASALTAHLWLKNKNLWLSKREEWTFSVGLVLGLLMTLSRGPWVGFIVGLTIILIERSKNRLKTTIQIMLLLIPISIFTITASKSLSREAARYGPATTESAAYRIDLLKQYTDVAIQGGAWGWGSHWEIKDGMRSIDNDYYLLWLEYGWVGLSLFLAIVIFNIVKLLTRMRVAEKEASGAIFLILAIQAVVLVSIATVWLGGQTEPFFFMLIGWAEGFLCKSPETRNVETEPSRSIEITPFHFKRVLT